MQPSEKSETNTICNMCGLTCNLGPTGPHGTFEPHGLIGVTVGGGYESTPGNGHGALDDMTSYRFSLCEFCLDAMFAKFVVPPETWDYDYQNEDSKPFRPAGQRVWEDEWRTWKWEFFEEQERRQKARK